ncbi:MAG: hypothetical protein K1060chlam4_00335 [Candidatus Anoxychlamydiales bacterium]|nr:hypothetical protein [Candidatus Anoxychlamydiales bacterium]
MSLENILDLGSNILTEHILPRLNIIDDLRFSQTSSKCCKFAKSDALWKKMAKKLHLPISFDAKNIYFLVKDYIQKISYYKIAEYPQLPSLNTHQIVCFISSIDPNTIYAYIFYPIKGKLRDISPFITHEIDDDLELIAEAIKRVQKARKDHKMEPVANKRMSKLSSEVKKSVFDMLEADGNWKIQVAKDTIEKLFIENIIQSNFYSDD